MPLASANWPKSLKNQLSQSSPFLLLTCSLLLILVYLIEITIVATNFPSGVILCTLEVIFSSIAAFKLLERIGNHESLDTRKGLALLSFFFGLLAATDGAYMFLFYFLDLSRTTTLAVVFCTIPYSVAFLSCTFAILRLTRSDRNLHSTWKTLILPLALSIPVLINLLILLVPVLFASYEKNGINLYLLAKIFNLSTSFLLINTALAVLLRTRDKYCSIFSIGVVFIVLVNWALETQNLSGATFTFGFFEFFWAAGILLCMFSVTLSDNKTFDFASRREFSLTSHYRYLILIIVSIFLGIIQFFAPMNVTAIRVITALTAIGCLTAVLLSQFLTEKIASLISDFGQAIGKANQDQRAKNKISNTLNLIEFPVELRDNLESIIATKLAQELTLERTAEKERQKIRQEANDKLNRLAAQFAHDIRSPIAALDAAVGNLIKEPEDTSYLIRAVAARINEIANTLLKSNSSLSTQGPHLELVAPQLIVDVIEPVIREKRLLFCAPFNPLPNLSSLPELQNSVSGIEIEFTAAPDAHNWMVNCQATELKRVISNLINNSFDAITGCSGKIHITLTRTRLEDTLTRLESARHKNNHKSYLQLSVSDNGTGIPETIIPKLMQSGATFGKKGGTGLGLYHARKCLESWGGHLTIKSTLEKGTDVVMILPCA